MKRRRFRIPHSTFNLLALAALVFLFLRQAAFSNLIFARGDTLLYFYPYWDYRAQTLLAGRLPLWNPYLFMGVPFLANSQAGVFYPLNWPLIIFPAPVAVKISIIVHLLIAAWGTFALARKVFGLESLPATFAAALFALGGYLTAQIEHVNQLQGLAWLPLALLATHRILTLAPRHPRTLIVHCSLLSLFIALTLTAGHTQTAFITLVACILIALHTSLVTRHILGFGILGFGIFLAFGLAAIQLIPTLELSRLSLRGGGLPLNEAVSFSLNPLLLGRALLSGYSRLIFSEFVAYIGVIPLLLALFALQSLITNNRFSNPSTSIRRMPLRTSLQSPIFLAALLAGFGLFFAFGGYNPFYLLLARFLPGFNLFRVPARWLALWALGASLLAGLGLQRLNNGLRPTPYSWAFGILGFGILLASTFISASLIPPGELGPPGLPGPLDLTFWLTPFLLSFVVSRFTPHALRLLFGLAMIELLIASSSLPLNHLTTPDAYASVRPAMTQLLAAQSPTSNLQPPPSNPPARFLSLSTLEFDPGDLKELQSELDSQLPPDAVYDAIIATKHKEVLSPNLPLTWRVPSVDGYDGGILPLRQYVEFAKQFGEAPANTDGRLRQFLKTVPANNLLNLTNTRWIITDKTGDQWIDNVFYDLQFTFEVTPDQPLTIGHLPDFQATDIGLVLTPDSIGGAAHLTFADGSTSQLPITNNQSQLTIRLHFARPSTLTGLTITTGSSLTLRGASLIDERTDTFQSLTLGPYRLTHSGDVKIYENLHVLRRAFITQSLISNLQSPNLSGITHILKYEAERVTVETVTDTPGYLILADTNYPGWAASVDGKPVAIQTAYGLFRAVPVPAGTHVVEFRFEPASLELGAIITLLSLLIWIGLPLCALRIHSWIKTSLPAESTS
jgi:hypothetical protein